jgi:hypothetical protein
MAVIKDLKFDNAEFKLPVKVEMFFNQKKKVKRDDKHKEGQAKPVHGAGQAGSGGETPPSA